MQRFLTIFLLPALLALAAPWPVLAKPPAVLVTIAPIHSLAAAIMEGVGKPGLLLRGNQSPHDYSLRPSDRRRIARANIIIRVGPGIDGFLDRVLSDGKGRVVVTLLALRGVRKIRNSDREDAIPFDPHIWLSPRNLRAIVTSLTDTIAAYDPANAGAYTANAQRLTRRIWKTSQSLKAMLKPVRRAPFLVFHDGYAYFVRDFGLNQKGFVTVDPSRQPGARTVARLRKLIARDKIRCVFHEPQFKSPLIATLIRGTDVKEGILDPIGADIAPGPDHWFTLMDRLAASIRNCLG
jgi:zinc transport system substrate-binding protein